MISITFGARIIGNSRPIYVATTCKCHNYSILTNPSLAKSLSNQETYSIKERVRTSTQYFLKTHNKDTIYATKIYRH